MSIRTTNGRCDSSDASPSIISRYDTNGYNENLNPPEMSSYMNRRQLLCIWTAGLALAGACLFPPWIVGWQVKSRKHQTLCFAPMWYGPSELLHMAARKELEREIALWKQAKEYYGREHAEWLKGKEALEAQHPVIPTRRAAEEFKKQEMKKLYKKLGATAPYRPPEEGVLTLEEELAIRKEARRRWLSLGYEYTVPEPKSPGSKPIVESVSFSNSPGDFVRLACYQLGLESAAAIILAALFFVSLRTSTGLHN